MKLYGIFSVLSFWQLIIPQLEVNGASHCYTIAVEQGVCKECTWDNRVEDCGDEKCWPESVPGCNGEPTKPPAGKSHCYTIAVEQGVCRECNWESRVEDCGDERCWAESVPGCNGEPPAVKSHCHTAALKEGVCKECNWETRVDDCGDEKCWPDSVPGCNGAPPIERNGYCANHVFGKCTRCAQETVEMDCGMNGKCWTEVPGCGDTSKFPNGFCQNQGTQCLPCTYPVQCPNEGPCMANVIGCYGENPLGNWLSDEFQDHPAVFFKCRNPGDVALTFDDGPKRVDTKLLLDKLSQLGIKATFFVNGRMINGITGPLLTRMEAEGHTVASHTFNHESFLGRSNDRVFIDEEILKNEGVIGAYLARGIKRYMRPPKLELDKPAADMLASMGYKIVQINLETDDWRPETETHHIMKRFDGVFKHANPSQHSYIVLQHDDYAADDLQALDHIAQLVQSKGFRFVTMEECIGDTGNGPVGGKKPKHNVCANEPFGVCTPCEATKCEGDVCIDEIVGCECWSEYPGCNDGQEATGYCDTDDGTCKKCIWSSHCGPDEPDGACLDIKDGCSTPAEAHRNSIPLCYRVIGDIDTEMPVKKEHLKFFKDTYESFHAGKDMGCPTGWLPASGTLYNSWPNPGTTECADAHLGGYNGCKWWGMYTSTSIDGVCNAPAQWLPRPDTGTDTQCRFPKEVGRKWNIASTWEMRPQLRNRKLEVRVANQDTIVQVNVLDTCSDYDCENCCSHNSAGGEYPLLDLEVGAGAILMGGSGPRHN